MQVSESASSAEDEENHRHLLVPFIAVTAFILPSAFILIIKGIERVASSTLRLSSVWHLFGISDLSLCKTKT
jgi:hypothetical protein